MSAAFETGSSSTLESFKTEVKSHWVPWLFVALLVCVLVLCMVYHSRCRRRQRHRKVAKRVVKQIVKSVQFPAPTEDTFLNGSAIVVFTAPWCPHCKHLRPALTEAAKNSRIPFFEVSSQNGNELIDRFGVQGFPEILRFDDGELVKYQGDRSAVSIAEFAA